jgi:hypothetical protein
LAIHWEDIITRYANSLDLSLIPKMLDVEIIFNYIFNENYKVIYNRKKFENKRDEIKE